MDSSTLTLLVALGIVAPIGVLSACGEDEDSPTRAADTQEAPATATETADESPAIDEDTRTNTAAARKAKRYMRENFGGAYGPGTETSWYVGGTYTVDGDDSFRELTIETDVYPDGDFDRVAEGMCRALQGGLNAGEYDLDNVVLVASDGSEHSCGGA